MIRNGCDGHGTCALSGRGNTHAASHGATIRKNALRRIIVSHHQTTLRTLRTHVGASFEHFYPPTN
jgi:hypothetical protein